MEKIPARDLAQFFRDSAGKSPEDTKIMYEKILTSFASEEGFFAADGVFLPLSVWKTRGFDITRTAPDISVPCGMPPIAHICNCALRHAAHDETHARE